MPKAVLPFDPPEPPGPPNDHSRPDFTVKIWGSNSDLVWASKVMPDGTRVTFQDIQLNGQAYIPFIGLDMFIRTNGHNCPDCVTLYGISSDKKVFVGYPLKDHGNNVIISVVYQANPSNQAVVYEVDVHGDPGRRYCWIGDDWHAPKLTGARELGPLVTLMALRTSGGGPQITRLGV